ncbi:PREDICTED: tropomodulin-2-like, partial [Chlamydotis macqueenii]|uniref:tropomodulin-2-like n=1 Tax=Chlamydotis macqueenii TaxID=187382 RepID=UPI000529E748
MQALQDYYQLNEDTHNALLLTVSEAARSSVLLDGGNLEEQHQSSSAAGAMSLPFRKELEKYKNINEDEILSKLSEDELKQLEHVLDDLDPENALLPAGFRQKDQTTKPATGPFDRERLLSYLEKQALEHKDREDFVPFTGEKK